MIFTLPLITFIVLFVLEQFLPTIKQTRHYDKMDHLLNWIGLLMQGCVIPVIGYFISLSAIPLIFPTGKGILEIGWLGCFLLNIVVIDFLYYWQHRSFHHFQFLWNLHKCHHASKRVDIWATSRNSIIINFLFVYFLLNPFIAFFCDHPEAFYTGAMITASLDIFRHTQLDLNKLLPYRLLHILSHIVVMPCQHHQHHSLSKKSVNLAANFIIWDILFGTAEIKTYYPQTYGA